ncbi:hypothetical protein [Halosolutus gelatinilyticus]|uniref:hypothetical protein n=1 Tax=Halosolutus gelatinilyticus TaxID=2931975 RepID=UPI001FF1CAD2|nr:hypothetical protein [Halosolutus gelatinilyticus]
MSEDSEPTFQLTINAVEKFEMDLLNESHEDGDQSCEVILKVGDEEKNRFTCDVDKAVQCLRTLQEKGLAK